MESFSAVSGGKRVCWRRGGYDARSPPEFPESRLAPTFRKFLWVAVKLYKMNPHHEQQK
jgi:hypothetical protein